MVFPPPLLTISVTGVQRRRSQELCRKRADHESAMTARSRRWFEVVIIHTVEIYEQKTAVTAMTVVGLYSLNLAGLTSVSASLFSCF
jgi:hypothetical protein